MANTIKIRRGTKVNLPTLNQGELAYCTDTDEIYIGDGTSNHPVNVHFIEYRILDKDTEHSTGTAVGGDFRVPQAMTVLDVGAYCDTAPSGSGTTIDINENGTSILSTKITIDSGEKSSKMATTQPVISDPSIAADAVITFDIDGVGSTTPGKGLVVWLKVTF